MRPGVRARALPRMDRHLHRRSGSVARVRSLFESHRAWNAYRDVLLSIVGWCTRCFHGRALLKLGWPVSPLVCRSLLSESSGAGRCSSGRPRFSMRCRTRVPDRVVGAGVSKIWICYWVPPVRSARRSGSPRACHAQRSRRGSFCRCARDVLGSRCGSFDGPRTESGCRSDRARGSRRELR